MDPAADAKRIVRKGYDAVSHAYRADDAALAFPYDRFLEHLTPLLRAGDRVLDLGCGCGVPMARELAQSCDVTGVDFSAVQIERARALVPTASFVCADMASVDLPAASFDAIVSCYALIHVPLEEHRAIFSRVHTWLRPGGHALLVVGSQTWSGVEDYLGAPMFWSHEGTETNLRWIEEAGLTVLTHEFIPEGDVGHTMVLARRPQA
ncbi:MAG: class I SAM-dependent methyltransferase [Planctomycetota bacterium]|nr:class I SAM-dependent methyltransferase [Planctomycetota bacterium]